VKRLVTHCLVTDGFLMGNITVIAVGADALLASHAMRKTMAKIHLSPHQAFMLKHFALGWKFKLVNKKAGSWNTYWSLRRRGLVNSGSMLTEMGRKALRDNT